MISPERQKELAARCHSNRSSLPSCGQRKTLHKLAPVTHFPPPQPLNMNYQQPDSKIQVSQFKCTVFITSLQKLHLFKSFLADGKSLIISHQCTSAVCVKVFLWSVWIWTRVALKMLPDCVSFPFFLRSVLIFTSLFCFSLTLCGKSD